MVIRKQSMRRGLVIAGFVLLAAIAAAGWMRQPALTQADLAYDQAAPTYFNTPVATPAVYRRPVRTERVVQRQYVPQQTVVKRERPFGHSVAIVAGSAGTGAAIGALAGGGRGAAIGALSGGAAGFIYDRLTRNK